jgi:N-methylhydantoinase B
MRRDNVELELFRQMFQSIPEEMGAVLRKTAFSVNIKERRDYSCAIYDARGRTIAMGDHMPVHLGAMPMSVAGVLRRYKLAPGDIAIVNDPFEGGTHLPDITSVAGVFTGNSKAASFYVSTRAHHADVGGMSSGSMPLAKEIYQEGLRIPPILLVRRGEIDRPLLRLILANVRTPEEREGDLMAQIASMERGRARLLELVSRYGRARLSHNAHALGRYAASLMRSALRNLREGAFEFEDALDEGLLIRVRVTISRGRATVDFSGTAAQADLPVNANLAITTSAVFYVFRCLLEEDAPANAGLMEPIDIVAPQGTLVNALPPAAMAAGNVETSQRITDVLLGALAQAAPGRIPAASQGTMNNVSFGGIDPRTRQPFAWYETIAGGMGASARGDGQSAVHTHMTNSWNTPVEAFEGVYPARVRSYKVRRNSGGAGKHRGGDGVVREIEFLANADVTVLSDRRARPPYGLEGGEPGQTGRNSLIRGGRLTSLSGKARIEVRQGDVLRIETPGGGGFGKVE